MTYWHVNGINRLGGVVGDTSNPILTPDQDIAYALRMSKKACADFPIAYAQLPQADQARLDTLLASNPRMTKLLGHGDQNYMDGIQNAQNRQGVRTVMPKP